MIRSLVRAAGLATLTCASVLPGTPLAAATVVHYPPWSDRNPDQFDFTIPGIDIVPDLHGSFDRPDLVVFAAGNQFMVMPALMRAFQRVHPEVRRIFYETLPPGIEATQIARGSVEIGNLIVDVKPDVFMAGTRRMLTEQKLGVIASFRPYATNDIAIEVARGNPKHIASLVDLGRAGVRISMPNPASEGVAGQIEAAYVKAGGERLEVRIMREKVASGQTILTRIHHRETPLNIMEGKSDAGPVWLSEALFQKRVGNPIDYVPIPAAQNVVGTYVAAGIKAAPHPLAARAFLDFVASARGAAIYRAYGFTPPQ